MEQVTMKQNCDSLSECLHHTPDGSNMSLTNLLLEQVKFHKEEINNNNKIYTLLKTSKPTYVEHKDLSDTKMQIYANIGNTCNNFDNNPNECSKQTVCIGGDFIFTGMEDKLFLRKRKV